MALSLWVTDLGSVLEEEVSGAVTNTRQLSLERLEDLLLFFPHLPEGALTLPLVFVVALGWSFIGAASLSHPLVKGQLLRMHISL